MSLKQGKPGVPHLRRCNWEIPGVSLCKWRTLGFPHLLRCPEIPWGVSVRGETQVSALGAGLRYPILPRNSWDAQDGASNLYSTYLGWLKSVGHSGCRCCPTTKQTDIHRNKATQSPLVPTNVGCLWHCKGMDVCLLCLCTAIKMFMVAQR